MKKGEVLKQIIENLGEDNASKIIGFTAVHALLKIIEEPIEELDNENINKHFQDLLEIVEKERLKFQEEDLKE